MAFFFGTLPLAIAHGAGAGAMKAIGTAVTGGMVSATFIDLFYIPLVFVVISRRFKVEERRRAPDGSSGSTVSSAGPPGGLTPSSTTTEQHRHEGPVPTPEEGQS